MPAFQFRMGAGFPGDVNRTHPASIQARLNDGTNPVPFYGAACKFNGASNDVRAMASGDASDTAADIAGVAVRPFPYQQRTGGDAASFASGVPDSKSALDVMNQGHILVPVVGTPNLGDPVYVWCAASGGGHLQGGFEAVISSGSTLLLRNAYFNGPPDATGVGEIVIVMP